MPTIQNYTGNTPQYIPPCEVVVHNRPHDCWISFLGKVYNVTPLLKEFAGKDCIRPLIAEAGKDISHWFNEHTGDIQHYVHPITGEQVPYCPHGLLPHTHPQVPTTMWTPLHQPWWKEDKKYLVGFLTKQVRPLRIINVFMHTEVTLNVCCEDTLERIMERYSIFNSDASSYTWRYDDRVLHTDKTLAENGIPDERDRYNSLGLPASLCLPCILIYYNDDLKWESL